MPYFISNTSFIGKDIIFLPSCHSTNDIASELLGRSQISDGGVVITNEQKSGKGQKGASWEAEPGKNLTFSVVLKPEFLDPVHNFYLNIFVSLGLTDALSQINKGFKIKWPNDIFFENKKVCGILIENTIKGRTISHSVIGIGLNVNQARFTAPAAAALCSIAGKELDKNRVLNLVLQSVEKRYVQLQRAELASLKKDYLHNLYWLNERRLFFDDDYFEGVIRNITPVGRLVIERESGFREYDLKEVKFIQ